MKHFKERQWHKNYYLIFSIFFIICAAIIFSPFFFEGKTFVWSSDGLYQHYNSQVYFGNYIRDIIKNLIYNHELIIPMWDTTVGLGLDIFTSLNVYAIGDPLNIYYIFTPEKYSIYIYNFLVVLKLYLAGLAFSKYCFSMNQNKHSTLIGSFIYMFCGYAIYASVRHPFFINPMIYLPIILIGIEYILNKKKPYLFIAIIALSSIVNFYFFYMLTIVAVLYALIRVIYLYEKNNLLNKIKSNFVKFSKYYIYALCLSAILFMPIILGFLSCSRIQGDISVNLFFYNRSFYLNFLNNILTNQTIGGWTNLNLNIISIIIFLYILKGKNKKDRYFKYIILFSFIALIIPVFSYAMNGFNFTANRWSFIFFLIVSFATVNYFDSLYIFIKKYKKNIVILFLGLALLNTMFLFLDYRRQDISILSFYIILLPLSFIIFLMLSHRFSKKQITLIIAIFVFVQILTSGFLQYSKIGVNYVKEFQSKKEILSYMNKKDLKHINDYDISLFRVDIYKGYKHNYGMANNINGLSSYYSVLNEPLIDYCIQTGNTGFLRLSKIPNYDKKTISNELLGVKYISSSQNQNASIAIPYGYEKIKSIKKMTIYENKKNLPFFYTYNSYIPNKQYDNLEVNQKEYVLLQGVTLNNEEQDNIKETKLSLTDQGIMNYEEFEKNAIYNKKDITINQDGILVKKNNSTIEINLESSDNAEYYLKLSDFKFSNKKSSVLDTSISISMDDNPPFSKYYITNSTYNKYFIGPYDTIFNLSYNKNISKHKLIIQFNRTGKYQYSNISVISQPMNDYDKYVNKLKEDDLQELDIKGNDINVKINTNEEKIGVLAIPYSKGWKAYVNGKETEVLKANTQLMGVKLEKGENKVLFKYCTPGLKEGAIISSVTILITAGYFIFKKIKIKNKSA